MLHTKFRGNRPAGSGEEDFLRFLPYMGRSIYTNFGSPFPRRLHMKCSFDWPIGFRVEDV